MKIIHCSDLHLDSPFSSRRSPESAREQRARLLHTFVEMTDWAAENGLADAWDANMKSAQAGFSRYAHSAASELMTPSITMGSR